MERKWALAHTCAGGGNVLVELAPREIPDDWEDPAECGPGVAQVGDEDGASQQKLW